MPPIYLTPTRYRSLGLGVDLSSKTDAELSSLLTTSAYLTNTFCSAPLGHDFRGGSVSREQHTWDWGTTQAPLPLRLYPDHKPIKSVEEVRVDVTNTQFITYTGDTLYIQYKEGWVEPISLAVSTVGLFGAYILPNVGLREPIAKLNYTYGWQFQAEDDPLVSISGGLLQGANQFWLSDPAVVVKEDGVEMVSGYTVDEYEGRVTIASYDSSKSYTASYDYPLPTGIAQANALVLTDILGATNIAAAGMLGLSGIRVEEVELRQSSKTGFTVEAVSEAASLLLAPFVYHHWG